MSSWPSVLFLPYALQRNNCISCRKTRGLQFSRNWGRKQRTWTRLRRPVIKQEPADSQVLPPPPPQPQLPQLEVTTRQPRATCQEDKTRRGRKIRILPWRVIFVGQEKIACPKSAISQELDRYLLEPASVEPALKWWKNRSNVFPNVATLARKYLCIPCAQGTHL